jgi:hypothetical protein
LGIEAAAAVVSVVSVVSVGAVVLVVLVVSVVSVVATIVAVLAGGESRSAIVPPCEVLEMSKDKLLLLSRS